MNDPAPSPPSQDHENPLRKTLQGVVPLLALFVVLYVMTATRTVQGGDTAEFVTVAATGGVAHPPGYPLFMLLASLCAKVLPGPMALRVSVATIACAVGALAVLHRIVLRWTGDAGAARLGMSALGVSFLFWHWSTVAEVLPGGVLTTLLVVWAALASARGARGPRHGLLVGLAAATGIANHHTVILLLPLCLYGWLMALPRPLALRSALVTTAATTAGVAAGFLPYLLLLSPDGGWVWGDTGSFDGLVRHFLRADYGSFSIPHAGAASPWTHPLLYLRTVASEFGGVLWLLIPLGVVAGWRGVSAPSSPAPESSPPGPGPSPALPGLTLTLLASWFLAGPLLLSRFTYPATGFYVAVVERFHLQPNALLAVLVGLGAAQVMRLPIWTRPNLPRTLLLGNVLVLLLLNFSAAGWSRNTVLEDFLQNTMDSAPPRALILTSGDAQTFGFVYAQEVLGLRPDVAPVASQLLPMPWYRRRLLQRHPDLVLTAGGRALPWTRIADANPGRPVLVSPRLQPADGETAPDMLPHMPFMQVLRKDDPLPPPALVTSGVLDRLQGFRFGHRITDPDDCLHSLECTTWDHYGMVLQALSVGVRAQGDPRRADLLHEMAAAYSPWLFEEPESP